MTHISLALVGLMWVLPFLYYRHAYPITTFYQEWGAAVLGLGALPLLLMRRYWHAPQVPGIVLLPVGLMLLMLVQYLLGRIVHFDQVLLLSLYLMFAALLLMLGARLREELGWPLLAMVLAACLLVGAELNALAGILQHYRWHTFLDPVVTVKVSQQVFGNIAQPNHFANYVALGLISLGLLWQRLAWRRWLVTLLALPLLFVLVLSGSRSGGLYLLGALALAWWWQRRLPVMRPMLRYVAWLCIGYILMHGVVQLPWMQGATGTVIASDRLFSQAGTSSIRLRLWHEAALMFAGFPLLGAGFGQFAYQHLQLASELRDPLMVGLYNNAHNIVMQLAAEGGLAGLLVLFATLGLWARHVLRRSEEHVLERWWAIMLLLVLAIHSLLEYPLWYQYFIGIAAILLGALDGLAYRLELQRVGRMTLAVILVMGALSLWNAWQAYRHLERSMVYRSAAGQAEQARDELVAVLDYPLFNGYAELFIAHMMVADEARLADKLALNTRALRYIPTGTNSYHQAMLLALSGAAEQAEAQLVRAVWCYPAAYTTARAEMEALAARHPAQMQPLLESAARNYEEYQRAVPAR